MNVVEETRSKCSRKTSLSLFFLLELVAYVLSCIALISPSWQYVYLENGRTEHHHGLWLDCKRDYAHDYGRSREYYETLYRLDKQQSPFDQFFLTSLLCVYKFDYYIDAEDLYDHNHDENRLQDDANQHLLLGWKTASLAALGFAVLTASAALLFLLCAFCHRTFICAAAVLVTVAALLSSMGLLIFYFWGNYQDNNIIKEDDGIYEQYFGWAMYMQIIGTVMHFIASFMGCIITSMVFKKRRVKLVKTEITDGDDSTLLNQTSIPHKRSFSTVHKVDSDALRKWEKDYMDMVKSGSIMEKNSFKRTTSVPILKKYSWKNHYIAQKDTITRSISSLSSSTNVNHSNIAITSKPFCPTPEMCRLSPFPIQKSILKATPRQFSRVSKTNQQQSSDSDLTYEYLPCDSICKSQNVGTTSESFATAFTDTVSNDQNKEVSSQICPKNSANIYDSVFERASSTTKYTDYEQPNSNMKNTATEQQLSSSKGVGRGTLINDVSDSVFPHSSAVAFENSCAISAHTHLVSETTAIPENWNSSIDKEQDSIVADIASVPPKNDADSAFLATYQKSHTNSASNLWDFATNESSLPNDRASYTPSSNIAINTFDVGTYATNERERSVKNLAFLSGINQRSGIFKFVDSLEQSAVVDYQSSGEKQQNHSLETVLSRNNNTPTAYDSNYKLYLENGTDRSVGSSAIFENEMVFGQISDQHLETQSPLNLILHDIVRPVGPEHISSNALPEMKKNNVNFTTV